MSTSSVHNTLEQNVFTLAGKGINIHDFYIQENGNIVKVNSPNALVIETLADLNNFFNITTQKNNLEDLLSKVKSLNEEETTYDLDTRVRACDHVWRKFQNNIEKSKDFLERKELELACQKNTVSNLLNKILQESRSNPNSENSNSSQDDLNSAISRTIDTTFDDFENMIRNNFPNNDNENCHQASRKRY